MRVAVMLVALFATPAGAEPGAAEPPATPSSPAMTTLSGPGEAGPPNTIAVITRGAWVPDSAGAELLFADVIVDLAYDSGPTVHALRTAIQWARSAVAEEDRATSALGNLRLEYWNTSAWTPEPETDRMWTRSGFAIGLSTPVIDPEDGAFFYEQRSEVTVPGIALWFTGHTAYAWDTWAISATGTLGLATQNDGWLGIGLMTHLDVTAALTLAPGFAGTVSVVIPGQWRQPNPTLLVGARWRPIEHVEVALGTHLVIRGFDPDQDLSPVRPALEVRGRL